MKLTAQLCVKEELSLQWPSKPLQIGSINEFDKATLENPALAAYDWQRGLSLYYAEQYVEGAKQFRYDIAANPQDAEEIIWTVMCDSKILGYEKALEIMPKLPKIDRRPVMRTVYDLFTGKIPEKNLLELGNIGGSNNKNGDYFYSRLYLSLYREANGDAILSKEFMHDAVGSYYGKHSTDYMTAVAKVHLGLR
jgi:lipoprotein NlpI